MGRCLIPMKRILASVAVVSVTGSTFIGTAQAQTSIVPKDKNMSNLLIQ